jgi:thioredoxin reductase
LKVAILGAGPAGMSCANALLSFGFEPVVFERSDHLGGAQRRNFHPNLWMLGVPAESGREMTERMSRHFQELAVTTYLATEVGQVSPAEAGFRLEALGLRGAFQLDAAAIVLCTGMRPRATPELEALAGRCPRVIIGPLSDTIRDGIRASRVLILGGGDNAFDHALFLAERGNRAVVCTRGRFSAREQFRRACAARHEITLREDCQPLGLATAGDRIRVQWVSEAEDYDWLLVMYGYQPNTEVLARFEPAIRPDLAASGHVRVDGWQRCTVPGIYAAGDLTESPQPSVPTAIAQGLAAARAIERDRRRQAADRAS